METGLLACIKQPISASCSEPNRTALHIFYLFLRPSILMFSFSSPIAQQALVVQVLLNIKASQSHSDTPHSVGLLWTSDQPVARIIPDNTQLSEEKNTHAPGGNRTRNPSNPAETDPLLRPRGHWHRPLISSGFFYNYPFQYSKPSPFQVISLWVLRKKNNAFFICAMRSTFPAHFMLCHFPIPIIFISGRKLSKYSYEFPALAHYSEK